MSRDSRSTINDELEGFDWLSVLEQKYNLHYDDWVAERLHPHGYVQTRFDLDDDPLIAAEWVKIKRLRESLEPYLDTVVLRQMVIERGSLHAALRTATPPKEVLTLIDALAAILHPMQTEQIRSPSDAAALLMIQMGHLDQEELRTVLLDTKQRVQDVVTVYRGSLNTSMVRVGEVYKAALRRNSAAVIVAHNHPSGDPSPSPEDVLVTRQIVEAGRLLDVDCLDHLVIGQGRWVSMRERGLGFSK